MERLKRRSAAARWDELRKTWRFDHGDEGDELTDEASETPAASDPARAPSAPASPQAPGTAIDGWNAVVDDALPADPAADSTGLEAAPAPGGDDQSPIDFAPSLPALPPASGPIGGAHRPSFVSQLAPETELDTAIPAVSTLPKPITSILPYYDYAPNGEDPCEYLCPRPPGCPEGDGAKPCPEIVALPDVGQHGRPLLDLHVAWEPTNLFHNPLYFEDHALERYGHTHCDLLQPFVSVGKFGVQLIGLPYQMALHPPCEQQYTLGWHRPGECVPYRYHLPPWNTKAAITAGAAYTGLIFLIP